MNKIHQPHCSMYCWFCIYSGSD